MEEYDTLDIIKFLKAAQELSLQELVGHLQSFLIEYKANWMEQNFILVYQSNDEPEKIFESADFISIPEKSLISLIQNDNLQMSEVRV